MMRAFATALALPAALFAGVAAAQPALGPAYGEGMVLQRGEPIELAGTADPGGTVVASLGESEARARADRDGTFRLSLPARDANATPATLVLRDGTGETRYGNILIGDVFLCSGQSNMELPVARALDPDNQLRMAEDDGIRLLMVPKATAPVPQTGFGEPVAWHSASRETVEDFSAACFYMGKRLRALEPDVPVGLIHSNWGGSAARAWMTPAAVAELHGADTLALLRAYAHDPYAATRQFVPQWFAWWRAQDGGREPWTDSDMLDWQPIPQFSFWNEWIGTGLDTEPKANVWLRQTVTLTAAQAASDGALSIGAIDDMDLTFINGEAVGYTFGWGVERTYRVPADFLREGENEILIAANNMWDTGGFYGGPERLSFAPGDGGPAIPLGADWEYSLSNVTGVPPRAPWDANAGTGVMHNAMIAPLGPMRLAGIAWYQGEADIGQKGYDDRLRALFEGWRGQFGDQARMLVVQLADFGERQTRPVESAWAELRQQQLDAVEDDDNAALVTAIDIGEPGDIHPANKNVLGLRLAEAYVGQSMPMPSAARLLGDRVVVTFDGIEGALVAQGGPVALGLELCGTAPNSCRFVLPRLEGNRMVIDVPPGMAADRVRHAWSDAPIVNLYDEADRPVPGFELPVIR